MDEYRGLIIVFILLSILVFVANFTVCLLVYLRKNMRTYTNGFVVSLAFSDLLIGSVLIPATMLFPDSSAVLDYLVSITPSFRSLQFGGSDFRSLHCRAKSTTVRELHEKKLHKDDFLNLVGSSFNIFYSSYLEDGQNKTYAQSFCHQRTHFVRSATLHAYIYRLLQNISASQTKCEARTRDYCFGQEDIAS